MPELEEDELNLTAGDLITVILSDEDEGWLRGVFNAKLGVFPANFVVMISQTDFEKQSKAPRTNEPSTLKDTPERRASLALVEKQVQKQLKEVLDVADKVAKTPKKVISKAIVTFDYTAQQPDELNLLKGMKLDIFAKDDEGWWTGTDETGKTGVFPFNFVKEIPAEFAPDIPKPGFVTETAVDSSPVLIKPTLVTPKPSDASRDTEKPRKISQPKPVMDTTVPQLIKPSMIKKQESDVKIITPMKPLAPKPVMVKRDSVGAMSPSTAASSHMAKPVMKAPQQATAPKPSSPQSQQQSPNSDASDDTYGSSTGKSVKSLLKFMGSSSAESSPETSDFPQSKAPKLQHVTKSRPPLPGKRPKSITKSPESPNDTDFKFSNSPVSQSPSANEPLKSTPQFASSTTSPESGLSSGASPLLKAAEEKTTSPPLPNIEKPKPSWNKPKSVAVKTQSKVTENKTSESEYEPPVTLFSPDPERVSFNASTVPIQSMSEVRRPVVELSPLSMPITPENISTKELYHMVHSELNRMRDELNVKLRQEAEYIEGLEREIVAMKRMLQGVIRGQE